MASDSLTSDQKLTRMIDIGEKLVIAALAFAILIIPDHPDRFRMQELVLAVVFFLLIMNHATVGFIPGNTIFLVGISGARIAMDRMPDSRAAWIAMSSLFWPTIFFFALKASGKLRKTVAELFSIIALMNTCLLIMGKPGFLDNPALDGCLIAATIPLQLYTRSHKWLTVFLIIGVFVSGSATAAYALLSQIIVYALCKRLWVPVCLMLSSTAIIAYLVQGQSLFSPNGRTRVWQLAWNHWRGSSEHIFNGFGLGQWETIIPALQINASERVGIFLYAHNEWLQILFEMGLYGFFWVTLTYAHLLRKSITGPLLTMNGKLFFTSSWVSLGIIACAQSPLRIPLFGLLVMLIFVETLAIE